MIKLYSFGEHFGVHDPSPFVLKTDLYLRMLNLPFESIADADNLRMAPKGKLPFIEDEGALIADSTFIIAYIKEKYGQSLDDHLSAEQRGISQLVTKSLDEDVYWCLVYSRWMREDTWPSVSDSFFGNMPFPLKQLVPFVARKGVRSALEKQGLGKHSHEEILTIAKNTLGSLDAMLGQKRYFFGDKPSILDAAAFGFLTQLTLCQLNNPLNEVARSYTNLVAFCERIHEEYYLDPSRQAEQGAVEPAANAVSS